MADNPLVTDVQALGLLLTQLIVQVDALRTAVESNPQLSEKYQAHVNASQDQMDRMLPKNFRGAVGSGTLATLELALLKKIRGQS